MRRVLEGEGAELDRRLVARQQALVKQLAFEQAGRLQNQRETVERVLRTVRRLSAAVRDDLVVVYPAHRRGWVALWGVRAGRIAVEREVGRGAFGEEAARAFIAELGAAEPSGLPLPAAANDEVLLVHSWVDAHRAAPGVVEMRRFVAGGEDAASAAARLLAAVRLAATADPEAEAQAAAAAGPSAQLGPAGA